MPAIKYWFDDERVGREYESKMHSISKSNSCERKYVMRASVWPEHKPVVKKKFRKKKFRKIKNNN